MTGNYRESLALARIDYTKALNEINQLRDRIRQVEQLIILPLQRYFGDDLTPVMLSDEPTKANQWLPGLHEEAGTHRKPMSAATKKKLAVMAKARWAAKKAVAAKKTAKKLKGGDVSPAKNVKPDRRGSNAKGYWAAMTQEQKSDEMKRRYEVRKKNQKQFRKEVNTNAKEVAA